MKNDKATDAILEAVETLRKSAAMLEHVAGFPPTAKAPNIHGLAAMAKAAIGDKEVKSMDVTNALYRPSLAMDRGTFHRRVVVTLCMMGKKGEIEKVDTPNGKRWRVRPLV